MDVLGGVLIAWDHAVEDAYVFEVNQPGSGLAKPLTSSISLLNFVDLSDASYGS